MKESKMKNNCKIQEENVEYKNLNNIRNKYDVINVDGVLITRNKKESDWMERYRPRKLFDLIIPDNTRAYLEEVKRTGTMPHTLLYSQKGGLGKTSISQVMTHELNCDFLTISANIDRGIQAVKDKVVPFSAKKSMYGGKKLCCIEEIGDATAAQVDSFKSVIDAYSSNMNIIITTNTMGNISQPLRTRFKIIDFNSFTEEETMSMMVQTLKRVKTILDIENIEYTPEDLNYLYSTYKLSFREMLMAMQSSVIDNKLVLQKVQESKTTLNDILNTVNNGDYEGIAKSAEGVNVIEFLEELKTNYLTLLSDAKQIPSLNMILVELQDRLVRNPAFIDICFTKACFDMIQAKMKFRV